MSVEISWEHPDVAHETLMSRIQEAAQGLLETTALQERELSLVITDDKAMRELNLTWRNVDDTTDVLSFPMDEGDAWIPGGPLGDIVISLDVAREQAITHQMTLENELIYLMTHAFCHLRGYDHHEPEEAQAMASEERRLLQIIAPDSARPSGYYPAE